MKREVKEICKALDLLFGACQNIQEAGACEQCSLRVNCLECTSVNDVACDAPLSSFEEFLGLSDDVLNYVSEEDYIADLADRERKEIEYGY